MKHAQKIPLVFVLTLCLILSCIPAFAEDPTTPGFGTPDSGPPVLHSISIDKTEVNAPGTITVTANVTDDISGVAQINASFTNKANKRHFEVSFRAVNLVSGSTYQSDIHISQYEPTGLFELAYVSCTDIAHNTLFYYSINDPHLDAADKLLPNELSFFVHNTDESGGSHDFGITNPNLATELDRLPEGETANIAFGNASELRPEIFDAIKGKNKTIALTGNGIQWVFNGQDITGATKSIDLAVNIIDGSGSNWDIEEMVGHENIYTIQFPNNGQLPGKAKIRVKADAAMKQALGQTGVYVYYYDEENNKLVNVASDIIVTDDSYFEFEITHCSDYVLTQGAARNPNGSGTPTIPPYNPNPGSSGGSSGGGGGGGGSRSSGSSKSSTPLLKSRQAINAILGRTGLTSTAAVPAPNYGSIDLDRSANDLVLAYIASLDIPRDQMTAYYVENYAQLYNQFRNELQEAVK